MTRYLLAWADGGSLDFKVGDDSAALVREGMDSGRAWLVASLPSQGKFLVAVPEPTAPPSAGFLRVAGGLVRRELAEALLRGSVAASEGGAGEWESLQLAGLAACPAFQPPGQERWEATAALGRYLGG